MGIFINFYHLLIGLSKMSHKSAPKMRLSFVELVISLGMAGQFNLEAFYPSAGGKRQGNSCRV